MSKKKTTKSAAPQTNETTPAPQPETRKKGLSDIWGFRFFLRSKRLGGLIGKCVLMLVIPYAYLLLCGLVFDKLLHWYSMTTFIFFSLLALYLIAIILCVIAIRNFCRRKKRA